MHEHTHQPDWTSGPAKWVAVIVLAAASLLGLGWSIARIRPPASAPRVTDHVTSSPSSSVPRDPQPPRPATRKLNLNTASKAELELLPGIGPAMAGKILDHRASRGPFKRIEDLDAIKGIGPRTIEKLRDLVTVE